MKKKFGFLSKKKEADFVLERSDASGQEQFGGGGEQSQDDGGRAVDPSDPSYQEMYGDGQSEAEVWGYALWDFEGVNEGELELKEGNHVLILRDVDEWLFVEHEGRRGYVPRTYIEVQAEEEDASQMESLDVSSSLDSAPSNASSNAPSASSSSSGNVLSPDENRKKIAFEILSTEENYVKSLSYITEDYKASLEALTEDPTSGVERVDVKKMFANVESISSLNKNLCEQLQSRLKDWDNATVKIGDIFSKIAPVLIIYTEYANMYQEGLNFYNREKKKNERFAATCDECKARVGMDLEHLLIMPVQRVPRYNLLLEDLFKKTPDDHIDKEDLRMACDKLHSIANKINDCMRQTAKVRELTAIASKTAGLASLLEAHRRLIRDTVLTVTRKGVGKQADIDSHRQFYAPVSEKMQLILFNDLLVYVPKTKMAEPIKFGQQVPLHLVWVTNNRSPNQFDIYVPGFLFTLQFDEKKQMGECSNWISDFNKTIDEHLKRYWKEKVESELENAKKRMVELKLDPSALDIQESDISSEFPKRFGQYSFYDSSVFKGWWTNGVPDGFGNYLLHGNEYEGQFDDGLQTGLGKCTYYTGDSYVGNWSMGLPNGFGVW
jgi:hypothetical protein